MNCEKPPETAEDSRTGRQNDSTGRGALAPSPDCHRKFVHPENMVDINLGFRPHEDAEYAA